MTADFEAVAGSFRRELLVHCYRMLGSVHDAEDQLQETLVRAWRAFDRYDPAKASMRTWLYRIATNACLTALEGKQRRPLPSALVSRSDDPNTPFVRGEGVPWLQPFPDAKLETTDDPASMVLARGSLRLALIAALQYLPPKQRSVLIFREVLDWPAAEVAEALQLSTAAVNSALQRAKAKLAEVGVGEDDVLEPSDPESQRVVARYIKAFEEADIDAFAKLLTDDVLLEMPPFLCWFVGRDNSLGFFERVFATRGTDWVVLPLAANGQPGIAVYRGDGSGTYVLHTLHVFSVTAAGLVSHNRVFQDAEVFGAFGLAQELTRS